MQNNSWVEKLETDYFGAYVDKVIIHQTLDLKWNEKNWIFQKYITAVQIRWYANKQRQRIWVSI